MCLTRLYTCMRVSYFPSFIVGKPHFFRSLRSPYRPVRNDDKKLIALDCRSIYEAESKGVYWFEGIW
jgi:hypothetical protein